MTNIPHLWDAAIGLGQSENGIIWLIHSAKSPTDSIGFKLDTEPAYHSVNFSHTHLDGVVLGVNNAFAGRAFACAGPLTCQCRSSCKGHTWCHHDLSSFLIHFFSFVTWDCCTNNSFWEELDNRAKCFLPWQQSWLEHFAYIQPWC